MPGGYMGKILFVNLTTGSITTETPPDRVYRSFIGGVGLGAKILYERMKPKADALGTENLLGFVTGPLTGTDVPTSSRSMVVTKSPLTGTWGDANCGGNFGPELKAAGYDAVFFTGISPKPEYLLIYDDRAELRDAAHLWGKDTIETEETLHEELGDPAVKFACIGPSGESRSLISAISNDRGRVWARSGVGAVMGSKRLKAIAVKGTQKVQVSNAQQLSALRRDYIKGLRASKFHVGLSTNGTNGLFEGLVKFGAVPFKNWTLNGPDAMTSYTKLNGDVLTNTYQVKRYGCWRCPIACGGITMVKDGPYAVSEVHKPEYETVASFGAMCLIDNLEVIIKANDICNRYGLDTISAGAAIAFAMECYERGIIGKKETGGIELTWGNGAALVAMLEKMAKREGLGDDLADGVKRAAERIGKGSEECAVHILGQEFGYHDPRFRPGRGTAYLVDAAPARHTAGAIWNFAEGGGNLGDYPELKAPKLEIRGDFQSKGPFYALLAGYSQFFSSSGVCLFAAFGVPVPLPEYLSAVTGWNFTMAEGLTAGQRIQTLRQAFNVREGCSPQDFRFPARLAKPADTGPFAGVATDFDSTKAGYYAAMNWDLKTGKPYPRTLIDLGLGEVVKDIW